MIRLAHVIETFEADFCNATGTGCFPANGRPLRRSKTAVAP